MGAKIPASWLEKFKMLPSVPTLSRGAISDGIDQPTGDAADSPPIDRLIHSTASMMVADRVAPKIPSPQAVPPTSTTCRTRIGFQPLLIKASTSHPPIKKSVNVANSQGMLVYSTA